jgi:hypothetical protein
MHVSSRMVAAASLAALTACGSGSVADGEVVASPVQAGKPSEKSLDPASLCDPSRGDFTLDSTNPYFPIDVGRQWIYEGEEDGGTLRLVITVLGQTEVVAGVTTRVVEERESIDGELVEVSLNFYAATGEETVCYFGEAVDIYDNGVVVSHEGAWRADEPGNAPGIFMPPKPWPGVRFPMELAPGIAEDEAKIVGIGPITVPAGSFDDAIRLREFNPLDGGKGYKVFAPGIGMVVDGPAELVSFST